MATDKLRAHLASLITKLRETGLCVLDQMEETGEISHDDRRTFQYLFCHGMGEAHFIMEKPKEAIACEHSISKDKHVESRLEYGVRAAVAEWLEYMLGDDWRLATISSANFPPDMLEKVCDHLTKLRDAVRATPSKVKKLLDDRFSTRGVTTGRAACGE